MSVPLDWAIGRIVVATQERLAGVDLWYPDTGLPGSFFEPQHNKSDSRPPLLLGDDGNLLLAVISATRQDGGPQVDSWSQFANNGVRRLGSLLHRAAVDYGIHRLLIIMIVPEDNDVYESLSAELSNSRYTAGQFRVVLLPHRAQPVEEFQQQLEQRLELFAPFPTTPFLKPIDAPELAEYVEEAFREGSHKSNPCKTAAVEDLKIFLRTGTWGTGKMWPNITQAIDTQMKVLVREGEGK